MGSADAWQGWRNKAIAPYGPGAKDLATLDNPMGTRLSPTSPVRSVTHVSGPELLPEQMQLYAAIFMYYWTPAKFLA